MIKLGSLFDGSGGFSLAGVLCGVEPVWAAEIEPYPIAVTRERFDGSADNPIRKLLNHHHPEMKLYMTHLGDISKINGAEIRTDDKATTITAAAGMSGNNQPVICLQGNGIALPLALYCMQGIVEALEKE